MVLGKPERNQLLELIVRAGLSPHDFDLKAKPTEETVIDHHATGSAFWIGDSYVNQFHGTLIKLAKRVGERTTERLDAANYQVPFMEWLPEVKKEAEAPDMWAELGRDRAILKAAAEGKAEDTPFTSPEQKEVLAAIDALGQLIAKNYELTAGEMKQVEAKLDGLKEEAKSAGRERWFAYAVGTLDLLQMTVLPDGAARHLTLGLVKAVGHLFGLHLPELPA